MKKIIKKIVACAVITAISAGASFTTCADWETKNGDQYYYKDDGSFVTKSTVIDGIRYKFGSDGVCQGKYTGWVKSKGKRFYYEDGEKQYGWVHTGEANKDGKWYYIDEKEGRFTGEHTIDGIKYSFSEKGIWDQKVPAVENGKTYSIYSLIDAVSYGKLDKKTHCGGYYCDGMAVIMSVDGKAEKKIAKRYPGLGGIVYKKAKYSMYELEEIKNYLFEHRGMWVSNYIDMQDNVLVVGAEEDQMEALNAYLDTLPDKNCIRVIDETGVVFYDD